MIFRIDEFKNVCSTILSAIDSSVGTVINETLELKVEDNGVRIDKYIASNTELSRSKIQKMIEDGKILVNNKQVKTSKCQYFP